MRNSTDIPRSLSLKKSWTTRIPLPRLTLTRKFPSLTNPSRPRNLLSHPTLARVIPSLSNPSRLRPPPKSPNRTATYCYKKEKKKRKKRQFFHSLFQRIDSLRYLFKHAEQGDADRRYIAGYCQLKWTFVAFLLPVLVSLYFFSEYYNFFVRYLYKYI